MKKELFVAIFLGSFVGIAVAFGIWRFTNSFSKSEPADTEEVAGQGTGFIQQDSQDKQPASADGLTIVRPRSNSVATTETIQIAGITKPNSHIALASGDNEVLAVGGSGTFEVDIELDGGINQIPVYSFSEGQTVKSSVTVVYSDEVEPSENLQAIFGTVTDITQNSLQVRTSSGEVSQVSVTEDTTYASTIQTTGTIEYDDLAIGDFLAVIGVVNDSGVAAASRIIVSSPIEETSEVIAYGVVDVLSSREFIVKNPSTDEEWSIDATGSPVVTAPNAEGEIVSTRLTSAAEAGDWIIIIGEMEDEELVARRIHVI